MPAPAFRLLPLMVLSLAVLPAPASAQGVPEGPAAASGPVPVAAIDSVFADYNRSDAPGCAVGVVRGGRLDFAKGYGMADLEHGIAIAPRSVFRIGSVSKQFTAAAIVLLDQEGVLSLDDPVRKHIPELPDYGPEFTVRRLVTHTSGVRDYLVLMDLAGFRSDDYYTDDEVVVMLARQPTTNFEPGSDFLYSNSGYFLLSQIVKRATGETLAEYAQRRIFEPLGMRDTHFHDDHTRVVPERATGYAPARYRRGPSREEEAARPWIVSVTTLPMIGDGGVFTTVEDLARWDANFDSPLVGGRPFVEAMLERGVLADGDTLDYGMGLGHGEHRGLRVIAHGGAFVGYRAASLRYPEQGVSVYALCNRADADPGARTRRVGEALLGPHMGDAGEDAASDGGGRPSVDTLNVSADELGPYAGEYYSSVVDASYRIRLDGEGLRLEVGNGLDGPMAPVGEDVFRRGPLTLRFERDGSGTVTGFRVDAGRVRGIRFERRGS